MARVEAPTAVQAVNVSGAGDSCANCGVHLAADQRYCVDCGHPRSASRIPTLLRDVEAAPVATPPLRAARMSANTTLIAGIGTLLLAMGIGVFIGSQAVSGDNGSSRFPPQVTVVSSGGSGAAGGTPASAPAAAATTPTPAKSKVAAPAAPKPAAAKKVATPAAATKPPANAVHVGSPGSGPGYQNGKFTGNFFGGG